MTESADISDDVGFIRSFLLRIPYGVRTSLAAIVAVGLLVLVAFAIYHLTAEVSYSDVMQALADTTWSDMGLAFLFTALSYIALICYDINAIDFIGRKLPLPQVAMTAFSAYAVGNTAGFGALSGGAIRYRAYTRLGLNPDEIARVIAFVTLAFGLGLLAVTAISLLVIAKHVGNVVGIDSAILRGVALLIIAVMLGLLYIGRNGRVLNLGPLSVKLPDSRTASRQFLVTALDVAASASVLYVLLPENTIGWLSFLAVYSTAVGLGVLSHVPAGLGVFETVIIAALGNTVSIDAVLSSLVLYRVIYYVVPLIMATIFVIGTELRQLAAHPLASGVRRVSVKLTPMLLGAFSLMLGTMLIFSSVTPADDGNLDLLSSYFPLVIVEAAHFFSSILGLALVIAARGLGQRLDGAWWFALICSAIALVFAFLKGVAVVEASMLAIFLVGLVVNARQFKRPASLLNQAFAPAWMMAVVIILAGAVTILLFVYRDTDYSHDLWWQFEFAEDAPRSLRAMLGLMIFASAGAIVSLLRPAATRPAPVSADDVARAIAIVDKHDVADANLVRMGDKRIMFSDKGNAFIMYGVQGRSWIALFDPVGSRQEFPELVWRFVETARAAGCRAVFYQISPVSLPSCADAGLRAYRLGELAIVDLRTFELKGGKWANLRQAASKAVRDGLEFSLLTTEELPQHLEELQQVSDAWLADHNTREKGFSLGSFDSEYILSQPVGVLRKDGKIVAFTTIMVTTTKQEGTVDLMRFTPDAPKGSMDFLFFKVLEHLREAEFAHFNLGMAPLSGLSRRDNAPVWDRIGGTIFEHGERFYNFKGLRAFKTKFHPEWQPRYLAVSGGINPVIALMDVTFLIGGGLRGVVGK